LKDTLKLRWLAVLAALLFIAMVTVNALANILPLNGISTGVLSDNIPNLFVPAGNIVLNCRHHLVNGNTKMPADEGK